MSSKPLKFPSREEARVQMLVKALSLLVDAVVLSQADVRVKPRRDRSKGTVIDIEVAPADLGRIVGKDGELAEAIYHYVGAFETEHGGHYQLTFAHKFELDASTSPPLR